MPPSPRTRPLTRAPRSLALVAALVSVLTALSSSADPASAAQRRAGPASHLLTTDTMPTAGVAWASTDTETDDLSVVGPCHLTSLFDIGAVSAVRRSWTSTTTTPRAVQVVARFADGRSAWRAHEVLGSWREDCGDDDALEVGRLRTVSVPTGVGHVYRVGQGSRATDVGVHRRGAYLSIVVLIAPAAQIPSDSTLARAAVKRIAATF